MNTEPVSTPVIVATLIIAVLVFGLLGWRYVNEPLRDAKGQDLSRAAVMPASMSYGRKPTAARVAAPGQGTKKKP